MTEAPPPGTTRPARPGCLAGGEVVIWRLDPTPEAAEWDSGAGPERAGGQWSPRGMRAVYASFDPAAALLEVAAHCGFHGLDTKPWTLSEALILDASRIHVLDTGKLPNPHWLRPGATSAGQQEFGAELLRRHAFVAVPSVVSAHSWNIVFDPGHAAALYRLRAQHPFALDPRLHPPC